MQVSPVLRVWTNPDGTEEVAYWCPGCKHLHHVPAARWSWDRNVEAPTLSPSVRHYLHARPARDGRPAMEEVTLCHYFVKAGRIEFCGDCRHELKGQTVPLPPLPPASEYGYPDEPQP